MDAGISEAPRVASVATQASEVAPRAAQAAAAGPADVSINVSIFAVALLALAVVAVVALVRALPWPEAMRYRKPLTCDACMGFWVTLGLVAALSPLLHWKALAFNAVPGFGLAILLLAVQERLRGPAFAPPAPAGHAPRRRPPPGPNPTVGDK